MRGLYVHIPFCRSKCGYCDFASEAGREDLIGPFLGALAAESARHDALAGAFDTLYVGGGTPSLLSPEQLERLFGIIETLTGPIAALRESTFEANPESLDTAKARLLKEAGFSRASLGLQAAQDRLLQKLGRPGRLADFERSFAALREAGFDNLNADLMSGLPGQTEEEFMSSLRLLLGLRAEHISFYALEVHEGTAFRAAGVKEAPEAAAALYNKATAELELAGLPRYEISNFARPGREALHNLNYWDQGEYLGLGPAAASYLDGERRANETSLNGYLAAAEAGAAPKVQYREKLEGRAKKAERLLLGLRRASGIELSGDIFIEFQEEIERLLAAGLVVRQGDVLKIRGDRFYVSNPVFMEFV